MAGTSEDANTSSSRVTIPDNLESVSHVPVTDGNADVAETLDGERMRVQASGRMPMQRVYLWRGSADGKNEKSLTNRAYDVKEDGPVR